MRPLIQRSTRACLALLLGSGVGSCQEEAPPRAQWIVHVGTDAPLPSFGDKIRVDILDESGSVCPECSRVFDISADDTLPLSFGVTPNGGQRRLRARLYRAANTSAEGQPTDPIIDLLAVLPDLSSEPLDVTAVLSMDCFGKPANALTGETCDPTTGQPTTDLVLTAGTEQDLPASGSWGTGDEPCNGDPPPGMACVQGGVFLLGSRSFAPAGADFDPVPEQLVHLSPYFLDTDELTVGQYRQLVESGAVPLPVTSDEKDYCQYTPIAGSNEAASINCISHSQAGAACEALSKRLPTEAEWEYAAGHRNQELAYPIEASLDEIDTSFLCANAVLARSTLMAIQTEPLGTRLCIILFGYEPGPVVGGSPTDITPLGFKNMSGNLSEWVADDFARYSDEDCWGEDIELRDNPICDNASSTGLLRGGSWAYFTSDAHPYFRQAIPKGLQYTNMGVRCAKSSL